MKCTRPAHAKLTSTIIVSCCTRTPKQSQRLEVLLCWPLQVIPMVVSELPNDSDTASTFIICSEMMRDISRLGNRCSERNVDWLCQVHFVTLIMSPFIQWTRKYYRIFCFLPQYPLFWDCAQSKRSLHCFLLETIQPVFGHKNLRSLLPSHIVADVESIMVSLRCQDYKLAFHLN